MKIGVILSCGWCDGGVMECARAISTDKACGTGALIRPADLVNLEGLRTLSWHEVTCQAPNTSRSGGRAWWIDEAHVVGRAWWIDNACGTGALIGALIRPVDLVNLNY